MRGIRICSNEWAHPFPSGDDNNFQQNCLFYHSFAQVFFISIKCFIGERSGPWASYLN